MCQPIHRVRHSGSVRTGSGLSRADRDDGGAGEAAVRVVPVQHPPRSRARTADHSELLYSSRFAVLLGLPTTTLLVALEFSHPSMVLDEAFP